MLLQEAVNNQLRSLEEQVDILLSWLKKTETQMEEGTEEEEQTGSDKSTSDKIIQKQQLCEVNLNFGWFPSKHLFIIYSSY